MINEIVLNKVASFRNETKLQTDKKVNLIYGLNGTGKSTMSNFLYNSSEIYSDCYITPKIEDSDCKLLVYNQAFIKDNFYVEDKLKGIFSLSKGNKDAILKINSAQKELDKIEIEQSQKEEERKSIISNFKKQEQEAKDNIWEIKTNYSGGDRVLEFCLANLKGKKDTLFNYIISIEKPSKDFSETIANLKAEALILNDKDIHKFAEIDLLSFPMERLEENSIFFKEIVGSSNSSVSEAIKNFNNSDWVKQGLQYLEKNTENEDGICPFCHQPMVSSLLSEIKDYFDEAYEKDLYLLQYLLNKYKEGKELFPKIAAFDDIIHLKDLKESFNLKTKNLLSIINSNIALIESKIKSPSISVSLKKSQFALKELNQVIGSANDLIKLFNAKIDNRTSALEKLKTSFWSLMRLQHDHTVSSFLESQDKKNRNLINIQKSISDLERRSDLQNKIILREQKNVINIDDAIDSINSGLLDIGIDSFKIEKQPDNLYGITRGNDNYNVFRSLSEGEKMIISFFYFIELCNGKQEESETVKKKIIVIDDPISSLSHIYIFNIKRLIYNKFLCSDKYEQIFILTHSLYFFYELADINHERRECTQKLFRLQKNLNGSEIKEMKYEEIQNDYQSYWYIVKDEKQPPALIANCMRNIIEYFFNFVEKRNLNVTFQKPVLQQPKFQAFNRYINRESHSSGQNIFDIKEFDYIDFKEAFRLVFKETGYEEHYTRMIK